MSARAQPDGPSLQALIAHTRAAVTFRFVSRGTRLGTAVYSYGATDLGTDALRLVSVQAHAPQSASVLVVTGGRGWLFDPSVGPGSTTPFSARGPLTALFQRGDETYPGEVLREMGDLTAPLKFLGPSTDGIGTKRYGLSENNPQGAYGTRLTLIVWTDAHGRIVQYLERFGPQAGSGTAGVLEGAEVEARLYDLGVPEEITAPSPGPVEPCTPAPAGWTGFDGMGAAVQAAARICA